MRLEPVVVRKNKIWKEKQEPSHPAQTMRDQWKIFEINFVRIIDGVFGLVN